MKDIGSTVGVHSCMGMGAEVESPGCMCAAIRCPHILNDGGALMDACCAHPMCVCGCLMLSSGQCGR